MKLTALRQSVLDLLRLSEIPQSVQALHQKLSEKITLSSLYRALDFLERHNLIQSLSLFDTTRYYAGTQAHSHYLVCENCHEIIPFKHCSARQIERELENDTGYSIYKHVLTFFGLCPECRAAIDKQKLHKGVKA